MAEQVLSKKLETIGKRYFYKIICDKCTDCSNVENHCNLALKQLMKILIQMNMF